MEATSNPNQLLAALNPAQQTAVSAERKNMLVLAGAGSGKTRILVHRIAWLLSVEGLSRNAIMAVTFTNKAANELRTRIATLLETSINGMWIGTFHGLAHRLLRAHAESANLNPQFQILDSEDQLRLIRRILKTENIDEKRLRPRQVQGFINTRKDEGCRASDVTVEPGRLRDQVLQQIYLAYEQTCARGDFVDFSELLLRCFELLHDNITLQQQYQARFGEILVDEFQDTNTIQYRWLRLLAGADNHVMAVGDDDQSIYGWRGARVENIRCFTKDFPDCEVIRSEQNYRSTGTILQAANQLIRHNQGRMGKELITNVGDGKKIKYYKAFNAQDEARYIADMIQFRMREQNACFANCAILYRSNAQSRILEEALLRSAIPYRIYGGQKFYERLEIKNALAYLRLLMNRNDDPAFERVINVPTRGIGERTIDALRRIARNQNCSLWRAAGDFVASKARLAGQVAAFMELIDALDTDVNNQSLDRMISTTIERSGLYQMHQAEKGGRGEMRTENLDELISAAREFQPTEEKKQLSTFLDHTALESGEGNAASDADALQMMTLHAAKGLEFPFVCIAGLEDGLLPHAQCIDNIRALEEERRLCYVGITRAMHQLLFTSAQIREIAGVAKSVPPSRFLREIPQRLIEIVKIDAFSGHQSFPSTNLPHSQTKTSSEKWNIGQSVRHTIFGCGVIGNVEGSGDNARVLVHFEGSGNKWMVLQYANLQPY